MSLRSESRERLAVFARYPEPGRAKTRLIPALGAEGAAKVSGEMVRHTLRTTDDLATRRAVRVEVWTTGGDRDPFCGMFGARAYREQCVGDLGDRMADALRAMLADGDSTAIIIGTDCPAIDANMLITAFDSLRTHDVVIGPANDGGYYLIGLRANAPGLFDGMAWGTETVLAETLRRAAILDLRVNQLQALDDVDDLNGLVVWERFRSDDEWSDKSPRPTLSVVIPAWKEAESIAATIRSARYDGVEIIVADCGGDGDATAEIATNEGARVVRSRRGRGPQLNAGAAVARGEALLFLHADTRVPEGYSADVLETLASADVAIGAFRLGIDRPGILMRGIEAAVRFRCAVFALPYGDQALFLRSATFAALGGFDDIPIMEDVDLVRRARRLGRVRVVRKAVRTSGRRWDRSGVVAMTLVNQFCMLGYDLGVAPRRLAAWRDRLTGTDRAGSRSSGQAELFTRKMQ